MDESWFWCVTHARAERERMAFADKQVHQTHMLNGCTLVGPYFTEAEAVEWGTRPILCAHADRNGEGAHWKRAGEPCPADEAGWRPT